MNPDTPLPEVAQMLPKEAAQMLLPASQNVQGAVLRQLRALLVYWEQHHYVLDPVALEGIVTAFVASLTPLHMALEKDAIEIAQLKGRLLAAEILLGGLRRPGGGS